MTDTTNKVRPTSPLALRIAHDIAEQLRKDGEIWEAWMADYIEQEAMSELAEALRGYIEANRTARNDNDFRSKIALAQQYAEAALKKAGL